MINYFTKKSLSIFILLVLVGCSSARRVSLVDPSVSDFDLSNKIDFALFEENVEILGDVCYTIFEGRVLLACSVKTEKEKQTAENIIRKIKSVAKVYNHINVGRSDSSTVDYVNDTYISKRFGWSLLVMGDIMKDDFTYDVYRGVVYILGKAPNEQIRQEVINAARSITGVEKVISYITLNTQSE
jgi:osmotically-inducible protein OsmY